MKSILLTAVDRETGDIRYYLCREESGRWYIMEHEEFTQVFKNDRADRLEESEWGLEVNGKTLAEWVQEKDRPHDDWTS